MKHEKTYGTDIIPENVHKAMHNVSFTFYAIFVGVIVFLAVQLAAVIHSGMTGVSMGDDTGENETAITMEKDLGHDYCGTFFIWVTVGNNYKSVEDYELADEAQSAFLQTPIAKTGNVMLKLNLIILFICFFIVFRKIDRKQFFEKNIWRFLLVSGLFYLANSLCMIFCYSGKLSAEKPYLTGIFKNHSYYCQVYLSFGIPALIILTALILRQHTLNTHRQSTEGNAKILKAFALLINAVGFGFMLVRFGTRVYEIINYKTHDARLPFYFEMLDFPRELAESPETYRNVLIFRLVKDAPVFIAAGITLIMLMKIMNSAAQNRINTPENMKRFNICMAALAVSSVLYNVLGLHEISMISGHFSGIYEQVTYTIGPRSLADPILFTVFLWFVKVFLQIVPSETADEIVQVQQNTCIS